MAKYWPSSSLLLLLFLTTSTSSQDNLSCPKVGGFSLTTLSSLSIAANATIDKVRTAITSIHAYNPMPLTRMQRSAVDDCLKLLGLSMDKISWSLKETRKLPSRASSSDVLTWLISAFNNQDTCLEKLQQSHKYVHKPIKEQLDQITSGVGDMLAMVQDIHNMHIRPVDFPSWMPEKTKQVVSYGIQQGTQVDAVVALDGSGNYRSITDAINGAPDCIRSKYIIHVKGGTYNEYVQIKKRKINIMLVGDGFGVTIISGSRSAKGRVKTFDTPTFAVAGSGFIARDITFRNTAGANNNQAVALLVQSDRSAFYRCSIEGYQDTLYAHSNFQFYRECMIYGTVDFIFGRARAVFQNCNIYARKPIPGQQITITAQGRSVAGQESGFIIHNSRILRADEASGDALQVYLGRPWKPYSMTVFMKTNLGGLIQPQGWLEWAGKDYSRTLFYAEYENFGGGSDTSQRVKWPGYHVLGGDSQANLYTVAKFLDGLSWLPATGVPFNSGLD